MKICFITTAFPRWPTDNRAPFVYEAVRAVQRQGHQVKVIAIHSPGVKTHEIWDGMEIFRPRYLPEAWEVLQKEGGGLPEVWKKNKWAGLALIPFLAAHIFAVVRHARDCDILHANWTLSGVAAWAGGLLLRKPYVVTVQGSDIFKAARLPIARSITRFTLKRAKRVLALSHALADEVARLGVSREKIQIVPNGVLTDRFIPLQLKDRSLLILFVGSLIERKGPTYLLQAMPEVIHRLPGSKLVLVGEGDQRGELEAQAYELGLADWVTFTGGQTQQQVAEWMRKARLFVLPSIEEGLGVVLLEALASGTPCVGSRVGGIPDVVVPEVGRLADAKNPKSLAAAIIEVLASDEQWQQMSFNARQRALNIYDWDRVARQIVDIYSSKAA